MALHPHQKEELADLAVAAMRERGLQPEFSAPALQQLRGIDGPGLAEGTDIVDLTGLPGARSTTTTRATWTSSP
ncbi:hypothetical protein ACFSTJ_16550 [Ottowia pentelensis]|uniref:hypothetical protein n=1 Tax=Ottowia pentelensis TaxID=511108 RepID=UPI00362AD465